ncbi:hypothetical protein D9758_000954 [Tetrapyrgos nigripes]|uniref:5'-nucleotidase n=1 Tax=Tetrapyrgos nigripes TaxID=182062 RepID=A0A8H5LY14_9AGAR|nr:hypothetical protein D9758_000954 [Tetrapyrgos nigripes]
MQPYDELVFYHFNDVYHVCQPTVLSRFSYIFNQKHKADDSYLTIFSGDAFGPSLESNLLKGEHIIPVLNHLKIDVACYGNHDFDFGEDRLKELSGSCNFPWVLSNTFHQDSKHSLLASAKEYIVLTLKGYRIGFFGLAGTDWPSNCQHLPHNTVIEDPVQAASRISKTLRQDENVDLVVAITHMRLEEDILISEACRDVNLILGGHDHDIVVHGRDLVVVNDDAKGDIRIVKSGTDFRSYSVVKVPIRKVEGTVELGSIRVHHERDISSYEAHPEDPEIPKLIADTEARVATVSNIPLFKTACSLDGRSTRIRNYETNLGNLLADAVRAYYNTDIAFVNSGSVRCDRIIPEGVLTVRDVVDILPFDNAFVVQKVPGHVLLEALENSVSDSRTDGRFLQVSGLSFTADLNKPEGSRILDAFLNNDACTDGSRTAITPQSQEKFTVTMVSFIAEGFDGYTCFSSSSEVETLVGVEGALTDNGIMLEILRGDEEVEMSGEEDVQRARARRVILVPGQDEASGLPVVRPRVEDRILYM